MVSLRPRTHPLLGLLLLQFVATFIDSAWKLVVVLLGITMVSERMGDPEAPSEALYQGQATLAFIVYTLPLMMVSPAVGILSDRWSKRTILVTMKLVEVALMVVATVVLVYGPEDTMALMAILGLLGVRAAILSPAKYGILPEIVPHERLSFANGRLELCTFVAIVVGTALAGPMLDASGGSLWVLGVVLTSVAVVGFVYAKAHLGLSNSMSGVPLAVLAGGVGLGAVLPARLSVDKVEYGLIPLGALGIALFALVLGLVGPGLWFVSYDQHRPSDSFRSGTRNF